MAYTYKTAAEKLRMREQYVRQLVRNGRIEVLGQDERGRILLNPYDVDNYNARRARMSFSRYTVKLSPVVVNKLIDGTPLEENDLRALRVAFRDAQNQTEASRARREREAEIRGAVGRKESELRATDLTDIWDDEDDGTASTENGETDDQEH